MRSQRKLSQGHWRKKSKRGVSPIIATILLVAITVVLAAVLYILIAGLTKGPGSTPLATAFAIGSPAEAQKGANWYYNFSIQAASGGILANNLLFQVQTSTGSIVAVTGTMSLLNIVGTSVATYNMATATSPWTAGGTTPLSTSQQLSLVVTVPATGLSGDKIVVSGTGSFQGSISQSVP